MQKTVILILCWIVLVGSGCDNRSARLQNQKPEHKLQVIVHLEMRNEVVTVMSGHEAPVYTVMTKDGRILVQHLSEHELQAKLPNIYHLLKTSYAGDQTSRAVWAGI